MMPTGEAQTLIITPTYNERDNLELFLKGVFQFVPNAHVLIVDDNSPDRTGELADEIASHDARVQVMHRASKLGLGSAYRTAFAHGLRNSQYEFFFEIDTDLSHDPQYLPQLLHALEQGTDIVIGSRNIPGGSVEGWGPGRHILSKGGSLYARTILGLHIHDLTSGYKGFRRRVLESINLNSIHSEGYSFQIEMTYRALRKGFNVTEVPIMFTDRRQGASKMSRKIFLEAIAVVWKLRLDALTGRL